MKTKSNIHQKSAVTACFSVAAITFLMLHPAMANAAIAGKVQFTYGNVKVTTPAGVTRPLAKGEAVNEGDSISTALTSSAQIKMMDGGLVAVRPDTKMKFDKFVFNGKQDGSERGYFTLVKGGFRAVTGLVGRVNKHNYKISTPTATIGIRGTDHETYVVPQASLNAAAGAYSKVNVGETTLTTNMGTVNVLPNQMGFSSGMNELPKLQPINTNLFTVSATPTKTLKEVKQEKKEADEKKATEEQSGQETKQAAKEENKKETTQEAKQETKQETAQETKQSTKPATVTTEADATVTPATSGATAGGATSTTTTPAGAAPESSVTVAEAALRTDTKMDAPANIMAVAAAAPVAVPMPVVETVAAPVTPAAVAEKPVVPMAMTDTSGNTLDATNQTVTNSATPTQSVAVTAVVEVIAANPNPASPVTSASLATAVAKVINPVITDTIANLLNNASVTLNTDVVVSDAATLGQLASLQTRIGSGVMTYSSVMDSLANLNTNAGGYVVSGKNVTVSDTINNLITNTPGYLIANKNVVVTDAASVAQLAAFKTANGGAALTYSTLTDTAANLFNNTGGFVASGKIINVTDTATVAQLTAIDTANGAGLLTYTDLSDAAATLATSAYVTTGKNVTVTGVATLAQLTAIDTANGAGLLTYSSLSDTASTLATSAYVTTGINVTVINAATLAQLSTIASKNTGGTLIATAISDTIAGLSTSTYVKPGVNVTVTDAANLAQLATLAGKNVGGTLTATTINDAVLALSTSTYVKPGVNVTVTDTANLAQLATLAGKNVGGTLNATTINDTVLALSTSAYVKPGVNVTVTDAANLAQLTTLAGKNVGGTLNATTINDGVLALSTSAYVKPGVNVTVTDAASIAELAAIDLLNASSSVTATTILDTAANLKSNIGIYVVATTNVNVTNAVSIADLTLIDNAAGIVSYQTIVDNTSNVISGIGSYVVPGKNITLTDAGNISQLVSIKTANGGATLTYSALTDTAANLATNTGGFVAGGKNVTVTDAGSISQLAAIKTANGNVAPTYTALTDTALNLSTNTGGFVAAGKNVTVTDAASIAQLATIKLANGNVAPTYTALSDTVTNLNSNAGGYLVAGKNVAVTDTASLAQLAALDAVNGAGTLSFTTVNNAKATHRVLFEPTGTGGVVEGYLWGENPVASTSTSYVFDSNKNLTQIQGTYYETWDQTALVQSIVNSNIVFNGGTSSDTFAATDGSIYMGRWSGGSMTVTDLAATNPLAPFTVNAGTTSTHWILAQMPAEASPGVSLVKNMVGTANYTMSTATRPTDTLGNVGSVTGASLTANFTMQTLATTAQFTFSKTDPVNISAKNMVFDINQPVMTINTGSSTFQDSKSTGLASVNCTGADCGVGWWTAFLEGGITGSAGATAFVDYNLYNTQQATGGTGLPYVDMVRSIVAFSTIPLPTVGTNPPNGATANWESFSHLAVGTTGAWNRGRFNAGLLPQTNTNFVLDGSGNLVKSLHVQYNERATWNLTGGVNNFADANVTYSGGVASDYFQVADGSLTIGRWTGGQMTVTDNNGILAPLVKNLGSTSAYWGLGTSTNPGVVQSLIGTTTFTQVGATRPTDTFGNVGTVPVANLVADFTAMTVDTSVAFTIANQNLSVAATAVSIVPGGNYFDATYETGNAPTVSCAGVGCVGTAPGSYLGWMSGAFYGAGAGSADVSYKIWPTAPQGSVVNDIIQGIVALSTTTAPTAGANPPTGLYKYAQGRVFITSPTFSISGNANNAAPLASSSIVLDAAGNLVRVSQMSVNTSMAIGGGTAASLNQQVTFSGGVAQDYFKMADNSITFGRWLGGNLLIDDPVTFARTTVALKANDGITPTSGIWYFTTALQSTNYVQSLTGTSNYTKVADVRPTDTFGNVGTLNSATLTANFLAQTVDAATNFTIAGSTYDVSAAGMPILIDAFSATPTTTIMPTVTCLQGVSVCAGTYQGRLAGIFAGNTASSILLQYAAWPTTTTGVPATDTIRGLVALDTVAPPTLAPSKAVAITMWDSNASNWLWNNTFTTLPGNINTAAPNPSFSFNWGGGSASGESWTLAGATGAVTGSATSTATTGIQYGRYGSITSMTQANWGSFDNMVGWNRTGQWAYGVSGYLDNISILSNATNGAVTGQFGYVLDGSQSAPMDWNGNKGVLNSLTLSANFANNTLSTSLQATQGATIWKASSTGVSISSSNPYFYAGSNSFGQVSTVTKGTLGTESCTTCSWYLNGAFTGQNYAGAVAAFGLSDNSASMSSRGLDGVAVLTRTGGTVGGLANPLVSNAGGTVAPNNFVIATAGANMGVNVQTQNSVTVDVNNVLTNFGSAPFSSTAITCITCSGQLAPDFANTGIRLGTWDVGTSNSSWVNNGVSGAQFHWITGPTAPQFLVQALLGTANYTLDGGTTPTSQTQGVIGVSTGVINSANLTLDFNKQAVGFNFSVSSGAHNWLVSTPLGSEAPLGNNNGNGASSFAAATSMTGPGALSVLLDGVDVSSSAYVSKVSGQITGDTLKGAMFQYQLAGLTGVPSTPSAVGTKTYTDSIAVLAPTMTMITNGVTFPAGTTGTFVVQPPTTVSLTSTDGTTISSLSTTGGVAMNVATLTQQAPDTYAGFDAATGEGVEVTIYSGAYSNLFGGLAYSSYGWVRKHPNGLQILTGPFANIYFAGGSVLTSAASMPQAINATYTGGMEGAAQDSANNTLYLLSGITSLTANFTNSTILGSLTGIAATDTSTQLAAGFFNDLTINGTISSVASSFSGSVTAGVAPAVNASPVAIATGAATSGVTSGHFYGPNATEVSGTWALSSGTISASGAFGAANGTTLNPGLQTVNGTVALVQTSVNGVAGATVDTATPARLVIETHIDPTGGFQASGDVNNATRVTTVAGAVTGFDLGSNNNNNNLAFSTSTAVSIGTATSVNVGSDTISGFSWGRWSGGNLQYTDRVTNAVTSVANTNLHWIAGPTATNVVLPVSGTFNYTLVGGTNPTDNQGIVGTLNSASLQANFTAQTVNMGVNATVNAINYVATGTNMPIQNGGFSNDSGGTYTATANGTAVQGFAGGIFTGATGTGAGVVYGFTNGATVVNGVAAFSR